MTDHENQPTVLVQQSRNGNGGIFGTANKTVAALTATPTLLVMVILNIVFICALAYIGRAFAEGVASYLDRQQQNVTALVGKLFDHCVMSTQTKPFEPPQ